MLMDVNREPLFFVRVGSMTVYVIGSKPLASIGNTYCYLVKALQIIMMCRDAWRLTWSRDHTLKTDRSLRDPIVILKADCLRI
jgi:hypothetical protein